MVAAVDDGEVHRQTGQAVGGVNAGKAATDDYYARAARECLFDLSGFGEFAQFVRLTA